MNDVMFAGMIRLTIAVPDHLAEQIKATAGGNVSAWMTRVATDALLREEATAIGSFERARDDEEWEAERLAR
jgi:hypothetical protein